MRQLPFCAKVTKGNICMVGTAVLDGRSVIVGVGERGMTNAMAVAVAPGVELAIAAVRAGGCAGLA